MTAKQKHTYDIVLANGRVIDPETYLDGQMHVGITGDRIAAVSETPLKGKEVIDASGLIVAPGFIDMHMHGQDIAPQRMQAFDGVTTALFRAKGFVYAVEKSHRRSVAQLVGRWATVSTREP